MKFKSDFNLDILINYGFEKIDKEYEESCDNYELASFDYSYHIGHSRRGQNYYLLVDEESRTLHIYATEPDGSGGSIIFSNEIYKCINSLILDGVLENNLSD